MNLEPTLIINIIQVVDCQIYKKINVKENGIRISWMPPHQQLELNKIKELVITAQYPIELHHTYLPHPPRITVFDRHFHTSTRHIYHSN